MSAERESRIERDMQELNDRVDALLVRCLVLLEALAPHNEGAAA